MQGEHPMPEIVIEQFSKTNGELCDNVFLLSGPNVIPFTPCTEILIHDAQLSQRL